ncbi:dual specificity protein phosphatase family protein [Radicibacter daui]|uniref:dual specificity protein phosphatase family protein n=1 Tax=Radicibacter daui TaxID=3064829 RepID=UPI004046E030
MSLSVPDARLPADFLSLGEKAQDARPMLLPVIHGLGPQKLGLWLGNAPAALDGGALLEHGITSTLNLAINIDIAPMSLPDGTAVRRTHIGLIDGPGNHPAHLMAAVLALHGILHQASPGKPHYPPHRAGHVLVHCRGGRSRSVTVLALYLTLAVPCRFPTFGTALDHLRALRGLGEDQPLASMLAMAEGLLADGSVRGLLAGSPTPQCEAL